MFAPHSRWTNRIGLLLMFAAATIVVVDRFLTTPLSTLALPLYSIALLLSAFALLLGVYASLLHHATRVVRGEEEWVLSLLLVVSLILVFLTGVAGRGGTTHPLIEWVFDAIIAPGQATLLALTGFFIVAAAYRFLRLDRSGGIWILGAALLTLLVQTPSSRNLLPPILIGFTDWLLVWPVMAALRGALLGAAIALLFVALRLIIQPRS